MPNNSSRERAAWTLVSWVTAGTIVAVAAAFAPRTGLAHDQAQHAAPAKPAYQRSVAAYTAPDVKLTDADGRKVSLRALLEADRPVMMNFIFTSCSAVCSVMSATFAQVQDKLGIEKDRVRMVSVSIDPEYDTPPALKDYARRYGAGAQWSLLTGSAEDSIAVQRAFGAYRGDKMSHQPVTFLRAGAGEPWVRLDGFASAADVLREYRQLAAR